MEKNGTRKQRSPRKKEKGQKKKIVPFGRSRLPKPRKGPIHSTEWYSGKLKGHGAGAGNNVLRDLPTGKGVFGLHKRS